MRYVTLTQADLVAALQKEPLGNLRPGNWATDPDHDPLFGSDRIEGIRADDDNCWVCAVGAVIRNGVIAPDARISQLQALAERNTALSVSCPDEDEFDCPIREYEAKLVAHALSQMVTEPLAALSCYFEGICRNMIVRRGNRDGFGWAEDLTLAEATRARKKCIKFVKDHFPPTIKVYVGQVKSAPHLQVQDDEYLDYRDIKTGRIVPG